ncbi:MAG: M23 family metallopeptidase [Clostridia bacterium]|nr:M23 family metallopeptidase [Clostridia bacterium]
MHKSKGSFKTKALGFLKKNGVFFVLGACFVLLALATLLFGSSGEHDNAPTGDANEVLQDPNQHLDDIIMPSPTPSAQPSPLGTPVPDITPGAATITPKPSVQLLTPPVDGEVIWDYAMDELIYSKTLKHWTTHRGIDIAADAGTPVKCVMNGTVTDVYRDDDFGVSVKVEHSGGIVTVYSNLEDNVPVKKGAAVNAGDTLGYVGATAISECGEAPHLHFEYIVDGEHKNPRDYVFFS